MIFALGGTACEKNISLSPKHGADELVVDGRIESGKPPVVVLTRSVGYFSQIDTAVLKQLFVHDARVSVTADDGQRVQLREQAVDTLGGNKYYYYAQDSGDQPELVGRRGGVYTLRIETPAKSYEARTTIPEAGFRVDSVWWLWGVHNNQPDTSQAYLMARIADPVDTRNYARYFTRRNTEPFYPGLASVADDAVTNGTVFDFQLDRGIDRNEVIDFDNYGYFQPGDTITLKFCNIDKATFDFWHTWEYAWSNTGNPFSTPTVIQGNVPGALGYWGGYAVQIRRIIISR
jgi:hypothetical protein